VTGNWLQRITDASDAALRFVCFPHAGGTAAAFRLWRTGLPSWTEVLAIQYPGRGGRMAEAPVDRIPVMAHHVRQALSGLPAMPTVFFGHSMGGLVAFEAACQLAAAGHELPIHLFVSGHAPPHLPVSRPPISLLPDADFIGELDRRYAAVPAELMQYPDVLALLLPALRADIAAVEANRHSPATVLACPITVFGGSDDRTATRGQLEAWRDLTSQAFELRLFAGGHFYVNAQREAVLAEISACLQAVAPDAAAFKAPAVDAEGMA
jgi:surfactin synthase thioesterase subunit